ncbi:hypothetical protein [Marinirhabdus gelatinilytica]|uniref:Uncharacterized protein n=1 Tax=Marinirhabdus gelatinilytica TaxID=1703343 RepID=A0A370QJR9_9FLAO|nr:hypothetical protein [Marinirhabdus gelatinilytica]RDK88581.1 hypothetical protein C8D94_101455 [Marinirhabdus gelatinilytica]
MKKLLLLLLSATLIACDSDDDNTPNRSSENIEVSIDGGTPQPYKMNIEARFIPLPPTSGFMGYFVIDSSNGTDAFHLELPRTIQSDYTAPYTVTITNPVLINSVLTIEGVDIDYANTTNTVTLQLQQYGNVGQQVVLDVNGTYFDSSNAQHSIAIAIDVERDPFTNP